MSIFLGSEIHNVSEELRVQITFISKYPQLSAHCCIPKPVMFGNIWRKCGSSQFVTSNKHNLSLSFEEI